VLVAWAREFIRIKRLAYVVGRGAIRHGFCVEAQLRPRRREFLYELPGHFVHGTQVRSETRRGVNFGEQLDDLIGQRAEVHRRISRARSGLVESRIHDSGRLYPFDPILHGTFPPRLRSDILVGQKRAQQFVVGAERAAAVRRAARPWPSSTSEAVGRVSAKAVSEV